MKNTYKTLKIHDDVHSRLLKYMSTVQLNNGGHRITICEAINSLLDIADNKNK
ncbi:MAG: hypothetical protein KAS12_01135 [Candidatus Aenigmarchaeota archaeon]|nr:hypothetical protein [Candidatus Aenigmarchaeota archaeon]